jgi:hypothetical protein
MKSAVFWDVKWYIQYKFADVSEERIASMFIVEK